MSSHFLTGIQQNTISSLHISGQQNPSCHVSYQNQDQVHDKYNLPNLCDIFNVLPYNTSIKTICINQVIFDGKMIQQLVELIKNNTLQSLSLIYCRNIDYRIIFDAISSSTSIKELIIPYVTISPDVILDFCKTIKSNSTLQKIDFFNSIMHFYLPPEFRQGKIEKIQIIRNKQILNQADHDAIEHHRLQLLAWSLDKDIAEYLDSNYTLESIQIMVHQPMCDDLITRNIDIKSQIRLKKN